MKLLIDTHALLFAVGDTKKLSKEAAKALVDHGNQLFFSPLSLWEIAILLSRKRIQMRSSLEEFEEVLERDLSATKLLLQTRHFDLLKSLEFHHNDDPFDRLLAAQATCEDLTLISRDLIFDDYGVSRLW